jgi:enoyl-CoA hydratase
MASDDSAAPAIVVRADGDIRIVTLNRPQQLNAVDAGLHHAIATVWSELRSDRGARAIVLTGAGKAFCAGGDLDMLEAMASNPALRAEVMAEAGQIVREMANLEVPIVAAVNGPAVGLGCSLASLCDLVVMADDSYLSDPHVALGLVAADGGALVWPSLVGLQRAKEYMLLGDRITAQEAERIGLANRVVPRADVLAEATGLARRLASLPTQSLRETRRLLNLSVTNAVNASLDDAIEAEILSYDEREFRLNLENALARRRPRV